MLKDLSDGDAKGVNGPVWTDDAEDAVRDDTWGDNTTGGENAHEVMISVEARSRKAEKVFIVLLVCVYEREFGDVQDGAKAMKRVMEVKR